MRKSKQEAARTRERIIKAAARQFRRNGIVATGLTDLMAAVGLTHGGFYKHFESKDQVVAEACADALGSTIETMTAVASRRSSGGGLEATAATYLSTAHRDHPSDGCLLAALGSEIARCGERTRAAATDGFLKLVDTIAGGFRKTPANVARRRALVAVSTMIGALTMSRIVTDPKLSAEILQVAQEHLTRG
jgi:TetR/AcrR family transcriptional repressor of nem operon